MPLAVSEELPKPSAPEAFALQDTQEDEYYQDILPDGLLTSLHELKKNPYPGLRPFKTSEATVFFGRKKITQDLIIRLAKHRFLAVIGASGTGKSSLVRAGLLPSLKILPGKYGLWKVAICRPGKNPFGNFAKAVYKANLAPGYSEETIWQTISASSFGFETFYTSFTLSNEFNTLIIIDQFEELFRYRRDSTSGKNDSSLFVKMLIEISKLEHLNAYVIITMRSEYLGDCVQFPALVDEINDAQFLVPRLKDTQLREAIVAPTGFTNAGVDEVLVERLLGEIGDNMDQLPVLQHSLRRTYEKAKSRTQPGEKILLTYQDYTSVGRMENAIDDHANEIYNRFDSKEKLHCEILFKCITDKATDGRGVRRPLPFKTILAICSEDRNTAPYAPDERRRVLTKIINCFRADKVNFLMPPLVEQTATQADPASHIDDETEIDISHESIMRIWKQLITWVEEEAKDADLLRQLLNRDHTNYLSGTALSIYKDFLRAKENAQTWASLYVKEDDFVVQFESAIQLIKGSLAQEKNREIEQQERLLREQKEKEEKLRHEHELKEVQLQNELQVEKTKRQAQESLAKSAKKLKLFLSVMIILLVLLLILLFQFNANRINNKLTTVNDWIEKEDYTQARNVLNFNQATRGLQKFINFPKLDSFQTLKEKITADSTRKVQFDSLIQRIDTLQSRGLGDSLYSAFRTFKIAENRAFTRSQNAQLKLQLEQLASDVNYSFNRYVDKAVEFYNVGEYAKAKAAFAVASAFFNDAFIHKLLHKNSPHYPKFENINGKINNLP